MGALQLDQTSLQLADSLASKETAQPALLLKLYHLGAETDVSIWPSFPTNLRPAMLVSASGGPRTLPPAHETPLKDGRLSPDEGDC